MSVGGVSVRTMFAMGEMAARLQEDQDTSRARFAAVFERFAQRSAPRRTADPDRRRPAPVTAVAGAAR
jgi:hypothetical protein